MSMDELEVQINMMFYALRVKAKKTSIVRGVSIQFLIEDFGVVVCAIDRLEYTIVDSAVDDNFPGWRKVYVTSEDDFNAKREELVWELMKSGYMRWLRFSYPQLFKNLIVMNNYGNKIIDHRLKIWNNQAKYKFMILDNIDAKKASATYILSTDPGFFDYMPE